MDKQVSIENLIMVSELTEILWSVLNVVHLAIEDQADSQEVIVKKLLEIASKLQEDIGELTLTHNTVGEMTNDK